MNTETVDKVETCSSCGRQIQYETVTFNEIGHSYKVECPCKKEEREKQKAEEIQRGTVNCRISMQNGAGLRKREREMNFSNFIPKDGQQEAYDVCKAFAENWNSNTDKGLIINGPVGSGKSHLAAAICNDIISQIPIEEYNAIEYADYNPLEVTAYSGMVFISSIGLLNKLKSTFDTNEDTEEVIDYFKNVKLLVIDDLGAEKQTDWALEKIFEIIDHRYNEFLPIIVTTNLTTLELKDNLGDRIVDRLRSMCKLVNITAPSQRVTAI